MKKKLVFILILLSIIMCSLVLIFHDSSTLEVEEHEITSNKLPKSFNGYKILHLSDLHSVSFGNGNNELIKAVDETAPDVVLMTGDMVSRNTKKKTTDIYVFLDLARELSKNHEVYYIIGNHEAVLSDLVINKIYDDLNANGVHILSNEKVKLSKEGSTIDLYGMWYEFRFYRDKDFDEPNMTRLLGEKESDEIYTILMAHNPLDFDTYAEWGADLTFSGHVHGGVIRLPFIGGLLSPERKFFPKYSTGLYSENERELIVSRGLGGYRLFNRPHINVVSLRTT